ncbi:MAG: transposase [Planctomycetaceae bacterium]|nr:transposase [Planctomycetaceae bacterium]
MRGRRPTPLSIGRHDRVVLQDVARSETLPWYQVRRARTVLAIAAGPRTAAVAAHLECDVGTVVARVSAIVTDEMPNVQVLERRPIRRSVPGSIEQREFDSTRHGTVNLLAFLVVHTGRMRAEVLEQNDAAHYIPALEAFRRRHRRRRGVYLIHDGGPSHITATAEYFAGCHGWWRPRFTPARASWLDQAELLIHAFSDRYLKRTSWSDRGDEFIRHVGDSWPEYNERYAHPFERTWTNPKMRRWFARHGG